MKRIFVVMALAASMLVLHAPRTARAQADDLVTLSVDGESTASSGPEAAREIQSSVMSDTARTKILELMGEKRYNRNKSAVESKIVKQAAKFIPFVNARQPVQMPDGTWKSTVELKLSMSSMRKMIVDAGLLNDADGPASIVPLVVFSDRQKGVGIRWWQGVPRDEAHKFLAMTEQTFFERFQTEFMRQGFHLLKPLGTQISPLPEVLRSERLSTQDVQQIADFYGAPMVMRGDLRLKPNKDGAAALVSVRLQVLQVSSGRTVAEVTKQIETDPGVFETVVRTKLNAELNELGKELATQVFEAWQRGTLNTNLVRLSVIGRLSPKQLSELKAGLLQNVREIKTVKERRFMPGRVDFEVDYSGDLQPLTDHLKAMHLAALDTRVTETGEKSVNLEVHAK